MTAPFTYKEYKDRLKEAKEKGYSIVTMGQFHRDPPKSPFLILRHDVDLSVPHAYRIAKIEHELGISSTFFFRLVPPVNPDSEENAALIREMAKMGHEIALHYESTIAGEKDIAKSLKAQKGILEKASGAAVLGAALHKVKLLDGTAQAEELTYSKPYLKDAGLSYDAYEDTFMKNATYISDSARQWRSGDLGANIGKQDQLYVLTHPIWWSDKTTSLVTIFEELINEDRGQESR